MSVVDDIAAVEADGGKTPEQKRAAIYALKTGALLPLLKQRVGQTFSFRGYTGTLTGVMEWTQTGVSEIAIFGKVFQGTKEVKPRGGWPIIIRNAPVGDGSAAQLAQIAASLFTDNAV